MPVNWGTVAGVVTMVITLMAPVAVIVTTIGKGHHA